MNENDLHVGKLIEKVFSERNMKKAEFARRINTTRQNITTLFNRPNIDVKLLFTISKALDYDFFRLLSYSKDEKSMETEISLSMKIRTEDLDDFLKWFSDKSNLSIKAKQI